ncbi:MAG: hypothetical protein ACD_78C00168G0002 [uncultured bacterium (gcode 4)]|uniref:Uncharacterized protein n=1 Tax=uncultured bacterium (gcode 4) TaxID=1234023 RepID=K1YXG0_9BACT|nr:MAG: hypothetical protein ACD_78C00168G0002 [uncultured bacterium (gcode 4)]
MSDGSLVEVYPVFRSEIGDNGFKGLLLLTHNIIRHEIAHDTDPDTAFIIPHGMSSDDIITTGASLIDLSSLSDQVVVPDIAPTTHDRMIVINPTDEGEVVPVAPIVFCGMMDDDPFDFLGFLDRPDEWMSILFFCHIDGSILFREIGLQVHIDTSDFFLVFERGCGFWDILLGLHLGVDGLPSWTVDVSEGFIRSPIGSFDDIGCIGCPLYLRRIPDSDRHMTRLGVETDDRYGREENMWFYIYSIGENIRMIYENGFGIIKTIIGIISVGIDIDGDIFCIRLSHNPNIFDA